MNKTMKTFGTILACLTLAGTCVAAPYGGFGGPGRHSAPTHHHGGSHWHNPPPPPPPRHGHHHGHHHDAGLLTLGSAVIGGLVGGILSW